ncbi:MAG: ATP-binding cassette domain-containing protein [Alphaproteobacteria bacterium]|nr:ATP-binding cassette domain-containing protein [Alphaproteobacteria bacterium]
MSPIELIAIAKHYGSIKAADAVDLHLEEGELVTIPGPSGSGKTTLLILIAGLAPPTSEQP